MNFNQNILEWGWNVFFQTQLDLRPLIEGEVVARIINQERELYRVIYFTAKGEEKAQAQLTGKFRYEHEDINLEYPGVGDWVICKLHSDGAQALIHEVLERKSCFYRKEPGSGARAQVVAANVDTIFVTMSANQDFNLNRLDRYMSLAWESNASPVIVLTKADLCEDIHSLTQEVESHHVGVPVHAVSSLQPETVQTLMPYLAQGRSLVLLGSSGVGKSTLGNVLLEKEQLKTQGIREGDDKGKHTTTSRSLYQLPSGALLMDTPGMRELGLLDHREGFENQFEDVITLTTQCRFSDCQHASEPGCAILQALESGDLTEERWESFQNLDRELRYFQRKSDPEIARAERQKWKKISQNMRVRLKHKSRGEI
ncbi:ribosome small subunit-dependent GTPase A [Bdellovibrio bacteriovorus]|uniref:ribosome small subunit-dependent GTPase A n=1 Tax=Bdellovibrio bacteriovorus TaxID=959 RepID=UPI0035A6EC84